MSRRLIHILSTFISIIFVILFTSTCGVSTHLPSDSTDTQVHIVDSIAWHDSTVLHHVYKERYNDYTSLLDTLNMSTTYSSFSSWIDTTNNVLKGKAENKDIDIPVKIKWKEKIVYRDSIRVVHEPYPVEVIKEVKTHFWYENILWTLSGLCIMFLLLLGFKIYRKLSLHV